MIELYAKSAFSLATVALSHGWIQLAPFEWDEKEEILKYIIRLSNGKVIQLSIEGTPAGVFVESNEPVNQIELAEVVETVTWMLDLDQDLSDFYALVHFEPGLSQTELKRQGRILRSATFFEDVVKTILTTNTLWGGTRRMVRNLVDNFGSPFPGNPSTHAFPGPDQIACIDQDTLNAKVKMGYRTPYIMELSRKVANGELDLEAFKKNDLPTPELRKELMEIKGVGSYASAVLLAMLGRFDYLPIDSYALKMVSREWYAGQPVGKKEVESVFEKWGKWKGLAYWYWDWGTRS